MNAKTLLGGASVALLCGLPLMRAQNIYVASYKVTTLAGVAYDATAWKDATGTDARFSGIVGMAADPDGNLYVTDSLTSTIRKVSPLGVVTTVAGSAGLTGTSNGVGSAARFNGPAGICVGPDRSIYIADRNNNAIRRMAPDGTVSTLAGANRPGPDGIGSADGTGTAARFFNPAGILVDRDGSVYVADLQNNTIRKVTSAGTVTTIAGLAGAAGAVDGNLSDARFNQPSALAMDADGNIYVSDSGNHSIRRISTNGFVTTVAGDWRSGGYRDGFGSAANFHGPGSLALATDGSLFIADTILRQMTTDGSVTTPNVRTTVSALTLDRSGNLYVADSYAIRRVNLDNSTSLIAGAEPSTGGDDGDRKTARFYSPTGIAAGANGSVYVADQSNNAIRRVARDGTVITIAGKTVQGQFEYPGASDGVGTEARFRGPTGVALDQDGNIYVADKGNHKIRKISPSGVVSTLAGTGLVGSDDGPGSIASFNNPTGIAVDPDGVVYVADQGNDRVRKITRDGMVSTITALTRVPDNYHLDGPTSLAVDAERVIYVAHWHANLIRKLTPNGIVTNIALGPIGSSDGPGASGHFNGPQGLAVDKAGNLLVLDAGNSLVRRISPDGVVTTVAGQPKVIGAADGYGPDATIAGSGGLAIDNLGNLLIADSGNNEIRLAEPTDQGLLINVSARTIAGIGENALILGAVVGRSGADNTKPLLIRAVGPTLVGYGVSGALMDPTLELYLQGTPSPIARNDDWNGNAAIASAANAVGAFPFTSSSSKDSALLFAANPGAYSTKVTGTNGSSGIALAELYDASDSVPASDSPRLINMSVRSQVGTGEGVLIAGFVIRGPAPATVLIRAVGPSLTAYGVKDALADPSLTITQNVNGTAVQIATNDNWNGDSLVSSISQAVGSFPLGSQTSKDSALVLTLKPGVYAATVSGGSGSTGVALAEIYEVR